MEDNFEKKSTKKIGIAITIILVVIIAAVAGGLVYLNSNKKPEKIFGQAVENVFEMPEKQEKKAGKIELELSAELETDDFEMKAANEIIKAIKVKTTTEIDLDKKILNQNILALYDDEQIINVDGIIKSDKIYLYLNELFGKYIEINEEYMDGMDLSLLFETSTEVANENLIKDVKQIILDEVNKKELVQEKVELDGNNALKTTLKLTPKEVLEITEKVLKKVYEYEKTEEIKTILESVQDEIKYLGETNNYVQISIYTKGLKSEIVKTEVEIVNIESNELIVFELKKESENQTNLNILVNEETTEIDKAHKVIEITLNKENENKGTITISVNAEEEYTAIVKVKYAIDYDAVIKETETSNSIDANSLTEEDFNEIMTNIEENEILYGIIQLINPTSDLVEQTEENVDEEEFMEENIF